jgi:hypothetical protein
MAADPSAHDFANVKEKSGVAAALAADPRPLSDRDRRLLDYLVELAWSEAVRWSSRKPSNQNRPTR